MKTKTLHTLLALIIVLVTTTKGFCADPPGVGIGTSNPTGALLHVANPPTVNMPSLRLDSIPNIPLSNLRYFLAVDTGGRIVGKIPADRDTLWKFLGGKPTETIIPWGYNTFGNTNVGPVKSFYRDDESMINIWAFNSIINVFSSGKNPQTRDLTVDFPVSFANDNIITSCISLNNYIYLLIHNTRSGVRTVARYNSNNISAGPTIITFSGTTILVNATSPTSTPQIIMSSDGTYFYFNHNAGNSVSGDNIIAKYSLSGTTLSYVSSITLSGANTHVGNFLVDPVKGVLTRSNTDNNARRFDLSGNALPFLNYLKGLYLLNNKNENFYGYYGGNLFYEILYVQ